MRTLFDLPKIDFKDIDDMIDYCLYKTRYFFDYKVYANENVFLYLQEACSDVTLNEESKCVVWYTLLLSVASLEADRYNCDMITDMISLLKGFVLTAKPKECKKFVRELDMVMGFLGFKTLSTPAIDTAPMYSFYSDQNFKFLRKLTQPVYFDAWVAELSKYIKNRDSFSPICCMFPPFLMSNKYLSFVEYYLDVIVAGMVQNFSDKSPKEFKESLGEYIGGRTDTLLSIDNESKKAVAEFVLKGVLGLNE